MATSLSRKFTAAVGAAALALAGAAACSNSETGSGPADDTAAPEPRTLRFDPDHRLVSYAASEAPPRAEPTRKRPRHH